MSGITVISVQNVSKSFKLPHEKHTGLKQAIVNFRPGKKYEMQHVLKNVSFDIKEGEFFGIVGRNGSGKSTLLKILAQIYTPDTGGIVINGSLTPFIELGVGFNPELTGRENVYLNGALLGFDRSQVDEMYDDIVDFAEIERFMDQRLKNYSSGMQVRLAFSIAIRAKSDILLIDEVLAVGDAAFQQKCFKYFERLKREKRTIIFVSHDMSSVKQYCDRALLIDGGEMKLIGKPEDVALEYENLNYQKPLPDSVDEAPQTTHTVKTLNASYKNADSFKYGEKIIFEAEWPPQREVRDVGFVIFRGNEVVFATNSFNQVATIKDNRARLVIEPKLGNGRYRVSLGLFGESHKETLAEFANHDFLIYNQPAKGPRGEEWVGLGYISNHWERD